MHCRAFLPWLSKNLGLAHLALKIHVFSECINHELFFQGGTGQEPTFCPKKQQKKILFSQKSLKTYYFWPARGGGGQEPLLPSPPDVHGINGVLQLSLTYRLVAPFLSELTISERSSLV
jgi:hypothetical protein